MAQFEHLPIYKRSYDLCLYLEQVVRGFSRYHKYTLGADLRDGARRVLKLIMRANARRMYPFPPCGGVQRTAWLEAEGFRVLRFWNTEVLQNTKTVQEAIRAALDDGQQPAPDVGLEAGCREFSPPSTRRRSMRSSRDGSMIRRCGS
jgi:hypothetical protein